MIGDSVTVTVLGVKGNQVRIGITAPKDVAVHREEIFQRVDKAGQGIEPGAQVPLALDIATQAEKNPCHRHPRSISTPTPLAAGTAPGLVSLRRSQGI